MLRACYTAAELVDYRRAAEDTAILVYRPLEECVGPEPGQFYMLHVPGVEAIPLSVYDSTGEGLGFLVKTRGPTTRLLVEKPPRRVGLLGPLGRPLPPPPPGRRALLLAGGVGVAPLAFYAKRHPSRLLYGVRSARYYVDVGVDDVLVASDDGSVGVRGTVVDLFEGLPDPDRYAPIIVAGPTPMLCAAYRALRRLGLLDGSILVLEEYVRCGLGFCGDCIVPGTRLRLCREGPGVDASRLHGWYSARCP